MLEDSNDDIASELEAYLNIKTFFPYNVKYSEVGETGTSCESCQADLSREGACACNG